MKIYSDTHPWINFIVNLEKVGHELWIALGAAQARCEFIASTPLQPGISEMMHSVYLAKGIHGTTAIEGNTLSEEQVRARIEGKLDLPESKEYLGTEVDNVISGCNQVLSQIMSGGQDTITSEEIKGYNETVLAGLSVEEGVIPGKIRKHSVGVFRYRGAPAEDCEYLLDRMCQWLNQDVFKQDGNQIVYGIIRTILSHLYIAWIHPFGDGNGRTARLLEFKILLSHGVPSVAAHLLSNHYNQTRTEYYRQLNYTSQSGGDIIPFIEYAVYGFVDQLKEQAQWIRYSQIRITWRNYVYDQFKNQSGAVNERRRSLLLDMSDDLEGKWAFKALRHVSPRIAEAFASKTDMAIRRDINYLLEKGLVKKTGGVYMANWEVILAFMPSRKDV